MSKEAIRDMILDILQEDNLTAEERFHNLVVEKIHEILDEARPEVAEAMFSKKSKKEKEDKDDDGDHEFRGPDDDDEDDDKKEKKDKKDKKEKKTVEESSEPESKSDVKDWAKDKAKADIAAAKAKRSSLLDAAKKELDTQASEKGPKATLKHFFKKRD